MKNFGYMKSPLGILKISCDKDSVTKIQVLDDCCQGFLIKNTSHEESPVIQLAKEELNRYFSGVLNVFTVKLNPNGTEFQKKVWGELLKIPYGKTICYEELAIRIGKPTAARAVGNANGKNPIPIIIPCHRVIARNGSCGGYALGSDLKKFLLDLEKEFSKQLNFNLKE